MKNLYCPWRKGYSDAVNNHKSEKAAPDACVFCQQFKQDADATNFILKRYEHNLIILNRYPYNAGHLMVIPYAHVSDITQLNKDARDEMMELINKSVEILREALQAQGINIGMNLGIIGGAGIPSHIHMHIIPRFQGDTNFMATIGETKHISYDLAEIYQKLKPLL